LAKSSLTPKQWLKAAFLVILTIGLISFFRKSSPDEIFNFLKGNLPLSVAASLVLNILLSLAGVLPSVLLTGINTQVFGLFGGGVISWLGEILGAVISFLFYRYILGEEAREHLLRYPSWNFLLQAPDVNSFRLILTARILPLIPSGLVNLAGALSPIGLTAFLLATALGKIPSLVMETFIGHDLFLWQEKWPRLLLMSALAGLVYAVTGKIMKRNENFRKPEPEERG